MLAQALAALEPGDTLACFKLDRIGRSLAHLTKLLADIEAKDVHFRTVEDGLDTRSSTGKLVLHMLGAVAQFERDLIVERTRAGIAAAATSGRRSNGIPTWRRVPGRSSIAAISKPTKSHECPRSRAGRCFAV